METLSYARAAALGAAAALGIMAAIVARSLYTITRGGRFYQLRKFLKG